MSLATTPRRTRPEPGEPASIAQPRNLLDNRAIGGLLRSRWYPALFQWLALAVFTVVVWQLLLGPDSPHDNLGTALVWVLWWPLIPLIFVAVGRFWCAVCPFGKLSDLVQRMVGAQRPVPRFLKTYGIWIIDAQFILITWSDHIWGIVESSWGTGVLLLLLISAVVTSGAFFQRRTFCRYLCFLGGLSGNYARVGAVQLRPFCRAVLRRRQAPFKVIHCCRAVKMPRRPTGSRRDPDTRRADTRRASNSPRSTGPERSFAYATTRARFVAK